VIELLEGGIQFSDHCHVNLGASYEIVFLNRNYSDSYTAVGCACYMPADWCIGCTFARLAFGKNLSIKL